MIRPEKMALAIKPLYRARMMLPLLSRRTNSVPATEPKMHSPPIRRGRTIICSTAAGAKAENAISIVATTVTA